MRMVWTSLFLVACTQDYEIVADRPDVDPGDVAECGFSPISGTQLSVYDCNPVFTGTDEEWGDSFISVGFRAQEVLGHPFYQIWYSSRPSGVGEGEWGMGYAVSSNGTDWEAHPDNPLVTFESGDWDEDQMDQIQINWDEGRNEYVLWYQGFDVNGGTWGMGVKTSPNGVDWTSFNDGDPVLDFTQSVGGVNYCWPLGISHDPAAGYSGYIAGQPSLTNNVCQMYRFSGSDLGDGTSFDFENKPVLRAGPENYDQAGHASVATVEYADGEWYMFYVGFREWVQYAQFQASSKHSLNMATSSDGIEWEKSPDNPLPVNLIQPGVVSDVGAQKYGSRILLWVTDYYEDIEQSAVGFYMFEPDIEPHP